MPCLQGLLRSCSHFLPQDKKEQRKLLQQHLPLRRTDTKAWWLGREAAGSTLRENQAGGVALWRSRGNHSGPNTTNSAWSAELIFFSLHQILLLIFLEDTVSPRKLPEPLAPTVLPPLFHNVLCVLGAEVFCMCIHWSWAPQLCWLWFSVVVSICCKERFP